MKQERARAGDSTRHHPGALEQALGLMAELVTVLPTVQVVVAPTVDGRLLLSLSPGSVPPAGSDPLVPAPHERVPGAPISTVIIDDVKGIRALVRMALEESGRYHVVAEAGTGAEGIEVVREHQPDLVLLDLSMPGMDGLEALPEIRELARSSKVAIYTGFERESLSSQAEDLGAAGYVEKGIEPEDLVDELLTIMQARA